MDDRGYATGRARRAEILDTAMTVFAEVGYRGASLRDIAARCGITHPGLKHHFPTKDVLLLAVLAHRDQTAQEVIYSAGATGAEELHRLIEVVAGNATQPGIIELFTTLSAEATTSGHPAHPFFADRYRRVVGQLTMAYQAAADQGSLRSGIDPTTAARELVAVMDGLQIQWLYDPTAVDMAGILAAHLARQLTPAPSQLTPAQSHVRERT